MSKRGFGFGELRDRIADHLESGRKVGPKTLKAIRILSADTEVVSVGWDSLTRLSIVIAASEVLGIELRPSDCEGCSTFGQIHEALGPRLKAGK